MLPAKPVREVTVLLRAAEASKMTQRLRSCCHSMVLGRTLPLVTKKQHASHQQQAMAQCAHSNTLAHKTLFRFHTFTLRGWRPWRPVRVEQPNTQFLPHTHLFQAISAGAGSGTRSAPAFAFEPTVQTPYSQGAPTGALTLPNRCLHDAYKVGWRAGQDQWMLGTGQ
jgi:hypothetical protein